MVYILYDDHVIAAFVLLDCQLALPEHDDHVFPACTFSGTSKSISSGWFDACILHTCLRLYAIMQHFIEIF
jgi:hypothetical protein